MSEINGLMEVLGSPQAISDYHAKHRENVAWNSNQLKKITRLRLLSDYGFPFWDVSYCHGITHDDVPVNVILPFGQIPKKGFWEFLYREATKDRVYLKRILNYGDMSFLI